ncbi:DUF7446 family protein [Citrobacter koseri]|uniref:DUF7446 family protein n=1 Tax=Citrobacter koseri TaxID=545 RepID=UPI000DF98181|nr:hypothetical protein [Citrobacter koseri]MEB2704113.1 hypothetical protein [Citrobacter koseri]MEB2709038.1 hypothetical protein [Citrobacter koseri]STB73260.1 Uncharacterised protein [Citrobacter koseri]STT23441.1 Uncharacterised protein [Citrobacter koseri]
MSNPVSVIRSPLTNRIYAGRSRAARGLAPGTRQFVGDKFDVTDEALYAVAEYLVHTDDIKVFTLSDGREIHLRADVKEPSQ